MFYSSGFGIPVMSLITCAAARFEPVPLLFDVLSSDYFMYDNQNDILVYSLSMYALRIVYYNTNISSINIYIYPGADLGNYGWGGGVEFV